MSINIIACGGYLPQKIVSNNELEKRLKLEEGWIFQRTGILQRHELGNENYIDSCTISSRIAIQAAQISEQDIGLILIATTTPQQLMPSSAILLQKSLGINKSISFDMQAACSGFIYALILAESLMKTNNIKYGLVLGCDVFSKITDSNDPITGVLFGDGFGAVVLKNENKQEATSRGIFYTNYGTDTLGIEHLNIPWGAAQGVEKIESVSHCVQMKGKEVFKNAVHRLTDEIKMAMDKNNLTINEINHIVPHQANVRILQAVCQNLGIPIEKCKLTLSKQGNTSAASIPLAIDSLIQEKKVSKGDIVLLTAFGAGYAWGSVLCEF